MEQRGRKWFCVPCNGLSVAEADQKVRDFGPYAPEPVGHWNSAGGACCPHYPNTCGVDHHYEMYDPALEVPG